MGGRGRLDPVIRTPLTRWFDLDVPVIGAPMAGVAGGALARAVSLGGGLGMIGVGPATPADWITEQARLPEESDVSFGIGLMAWVLEDRPDQLAAAIAAQPAMVSVSFGDPSPWVGPLHDAGIAVATSVNTVADVDRAVEAGADVLVAQGTEAGGHTGHRATLPLLADVLARTDRPVVAAGGIATGAALAAVLAAGAAGAWVGTALLASPEGTGTEANRAAVRAATGEDTVLTSVFDIAQGIAWPSRHPGRALADDVTRTWHGREDELRADPAAAGVTRTERRPVYAGEAVGQVVDERSAIDVVRRLAADAEALLRKAATLVR